MEYAGALLLLAAGLVWLAAILLLFGSSGAAPRPIGSARVDDCDMRVELLNDDPVIRIVHGFVSSDEAREIIDKYSHLLSRSTVAGNDDHASNSEHESRTSYSAFLPAGSEKDSLVLKIERRAVAMTGKKLRDMETLQLVRYQGNAQFYRNHYDYFHNDPESQRTVTIFVYLNDTGGEGPTRFSKLGIDVEPVCGKACVWENCFASGKGMVCDDRLEHAGTPLKSRDAVKHGLNIWFRTMPFR
jgi:prolyl 4-hydroxylase